ncbi:DUF3180 domain-containing protein [Propionibacteriaceae bacterium Y1700]|uniref:DUF3180 domain-containing protein n=1 Tax=Microlunatus sp. Y1700 TaxID=3418487 RepID=UPI003DA78DD5
MASPASPPPPGTGTVRLTSWRVLAGGFVISAALAWLLVRVAGAFDVIPPTVPWTTPAVLTLLLIFVAVTAHLTHRRIHRDRRRIEPSRAVSLLVLGKATSIAGAVIGGFSLVYGLMFLNRFDAATPRERVINSLASVVACIGLIFAGRALEKACRLPEDEDEPSPR